MYCADRLQGHLLAVVLPDEDVLLPFGVSLLRAVAAVMGAPALGPVERGLAHHLRNPQHVVQVKPSHELNRILGSATLAQGLQLFNARQSPTEAIGASDDPSLFPHDG